MVLSLREFDEELSDADVEALNQAVKLLDEVNARFKRMEESMQNQIAVTKNQTQQLAKMADIFEKKFGCTSSPHLPLPQSEIQINHSENSSSELLQTFGDADDSMKLNSCLNSIPVNVDRVITPIEVSHVDSHAVLCVENEETVEIEAIGEILVLETLLHPLSNSFSSCFPTVRKNACDSICLGFESLCGSYHKWSLCTQGVCENALEIFCSYYGNILSCDDVEFKLLWPKNSFLLPPDKPPDGQSTEKVLDANITEKYYTNMRNEITCVNGSWCDMLDEFKGSEFMEFQPRCLWFVVLDAFEDSGKLWVVLRCIGEVVNWVWKFIILRWLTLDSGMQFEILISFFLQVPMVVCIIGMEPREWQMDHSTISTILPIICLTFGYEATHISRIRCLLVATWCYLFSVLHFLEISTTERSLMAKRMGDFKFLFTEKSLLCITTVQSALLGWGVLIVDGSGITKFDIKVGIIIGKDIGFLWEILVTAEGVSFILRLSMLLTFSLPRPPDSTMNFLNLEDKVLRRGKECYGCNLGHKCNMSSCYK